MARHRTPEEKRELGERARALRAAGRSRAEIRVELGISDDLAKAFLQGTTVPDSLRRPRAKDDVREAAVALRRQGASYDLISAELGVSKSTCSLWLRDVPAASPAQEPEVAVDVGGPQARRALARRWREEGLLLREIASRQGVSVKTTYYDTLGVAVPARARPGRSADDLRAMRQERWERERARRQQERQTVQAAAAEEVGALSRRDLHLAAVTAYMCEGTKSKPWARREQVTFINSDVGLLRLWLAYLDDVGHPDEHRAFSLSIHESADVSACEQSWASDLGIPQQRFGPANLKRHNPRTVRKNTGEDYRGCLVVRLRQCAELYQRIEGTWAGMMAGLAPSDDVRLSG